MPNVDFKLQPSRVHAFFLGSVILLGVMSVLVLSWPWYLRLLAVVSLLGYGRHCYWQVVRLQGPRAVLRLTPVKGRHFQLETKLGVFQAELSKTAVITRYVSVLTFQVPSQSPFACMLFSDGLPRGQYRQWLLRFGSPDAVSDLH